MSKLETSLGRLGESVGNLEAALELLAEAQSKAPAPQTQASAGGQQDMFSNGAGQAVAQRLDKAIQNVETLLGDS
ncbi:hypothetical protein N9Z27_00285 [Alphaproteobacteria bacterium]|nr:hypothetical protein [Alphaproteobacteria bacterium]